MTQFLISLLLSYVQVALGCSVTPIETIFRGIIRSPLLMRTNSSPNQFAGRTALNSGSATVTVSTNRVNSDSLIFHQVQAALVAEFSAMGRVAITSGLASATLSTPAVYSGDIIHATWESPNNITSGMSLRVNSIVDGVSFALTTGNGLTTVASGAVAIWSIAGKVPAGISVQTISPSGFFTFGWADGRARPFNTTLLWELRRST